MSVVQITSPGAVLLTIGGGGKIPPTVQWTSQFDAYQTHYEIQYRLKTSVSWSTLGKVASNTREANLEDIYQKLPKEFTEFFYRVVIYYDKNSPGDRIVGHETSNAYLLIFTPKWVSKLQEYDGKKINTYPLYDTLNDTMIECVHVQVTETEMKKLPLVEEENPLAGERMILSDNGRKCFVKDTLSSYNTNIPGNGYVEHTLQYAEYRTTEGKNYGYYRPYVTHYNGYYRYVSSYASSTAPITTKKYSYYRYYQPATYTYWTYGSYGVHVPGYMAYYIYNSSQYVGAYYVNQSYNYTFYYAYNATNAYIGYRSYYYYQINYYYHYYYASAYVSKYYAYSVPAYYYETYITSYYYKTYNSGLVNYVYRYTYQ